MSVAPLPILGLLATTPPGKLRFLYIRDWLGGLVEKSWVPSKFGKISTKTREEEECFWVLYIYIYIYILVYNMYNYIFTICIYIYIFAYDTICFAVSEVLLAYFLKFLLSDSHQGSTISSQSVVTVR